MKVSLKIENDEELRLYIKDCIRGQVLAIARDEYIEMVKAEIDRKITVQGSDFDYLMKLAIKEVVRELITQKTPVSTWSTDFIKPFIDEKLKEALKNANWGKLIEEGAKRKLNQLIESQK